MTPLSGRLFRDANRDMPWPWGDTDHARLARRPRVPRATALAIAYVAIVAAALLLCPSPAWADDYDISRVRINADVSSDGSMVVTESRTFDFDGDFHGVYWDIPQGTYNGREVRATLLKAGLLEGGDLDEFSEEDSGQSGSYQLLTGKNDSLRVKLFSAQSTGSATFQIQYKVTGIVSAWADTGELYWKFVSDGWDAPSQNVTCKITLPADSAALTADEKVRAWGHGPLDGEVVVGKTSVAYSVDEVGCEEYAEARVTFPVRWLRGMTAFSEGRLDTILSEEKVRAEEANARRESARRLTLVLRCVAAVPLACLLAAALLYRGYKRRHTASFDDDYFRDVPSPEHPSVLGALYNGGSVEGKEFTASLMSLSDAGAIALEAVTRKGMLGEKRDYRIRCVSKSRDKVSDEIDRKMLRLLFDQVAPLAREKGAESDPNGSYPLLFGSVDKVAKHHAESYSAWMEGWRSTVTARAEGNGYFTEEGMSHRARIAFVASVSLVCTVVSTIAMLVVAGDVPGVVGALLVGAPCAAAATALATRARPLSPEAVELRAKLEALRRWLCEFTRLSEAIPEDVTLWNRLLVMSVVLGVSDRVIKQLRVSMPGLVEDPGFVPTYYWVYGCHGMRPPARAFQDAYVTAARTSAAELAVSSDSSSSGAGGGFSSGGGGFGGGGGGGAF